jgi:cytochrome P450
MIWEDGMTAIDGISLSPTFYDPSDPATIQDPLPVLKRLQDEAPCYWSDKLKSWVITRYDDVRAIQLDPSVSADRLTPFYESLPPAKQSKVAELVRILNTWVAFKDPPEHTKMRHIMNRVLTMKVVKDLEPAINEIVEDLLNRLDEKGLEEFDFITEFANLVPASVIMDLLGVPRGDMEILREYSSLIQPFIGDATATGDKYEMGREGIRGMADYFHHAVRLRETEPRNDVISKLVAERDAGNLTTDELVGMCILFLFGGHETTTNLIGNGTRLLMRFPEARAALLEKPELMGQAVEEILRFDGPTGALVRLVKTEHELHGQMLKPRDRVFIMVNAANHDPRKFEAPERFDISRNPNPHLTFNSGPHFCLGAPLARAEGRIALSKLLDRFSDIELTTPVEYMDTLVMRGVRTMPVRVKRRNRSAS